MDDLLFRSYDIFHCTTQYGDSLPPVIYSIITQLQQTAHHLLPYNGMQIKLCEVTQALFTYPVTTVTRQEVRLHPGSCGKTSMWETL